MNKKQKFIITLCFITVILMGLIPPLYVSQGAGVIKWYGYDLIFAPSLGGYDRTQIDLSRLIVQWFVVIFTSTGFVLLFRKKGKE